VAKNLGRVTKVTGVAHLDLYHSNTKPIANPNAKL